MAEDNEYVIDDHFKRIRVSEQLDYPMLLFYQIQKVLNKDPDLRTSVELLEALLMPYLFNDKEFNEEKKEIIDGFNNDKKKFSRNGTIVSNNDYSTLLNERYMRMFKILMKAIGRQKLMPADDMMYEE